MRFLIVPHLLDEGISNPSGILSLSIKHLGGTLIEVIRGAVRRHGILRIGNYGLDVECLRNLNDSDHSLGFQ